MLDLILLLTLLTDADDSTDPTIVQQETGTQR